MNIKTILLNYLGEELKKIFEQIPEEKFEKTEEIRVRINKPLIIRCGGQVFFVSQNGMFLLDARGAYLPSLTDMRKTIENMSDYSLYAFEEELSVGYITLSGGHRVGITGKTITQNNIVKTIKHFNGLNIRVSHQILGCADKIIPYVLNRDSIHHTMIVSPPACGKTTLLRDMVRQLSDGIKGVFDGATIGVADERSEIAGCYMGLPQNDVGIRTDILDACPKAEGMIMLLRSMSPQIIAVDEIGKSEDINAIEDIINAGIKLICTVHGKTIEDINNKPVLSSLLQKKIFTRIIFLDHSKGSGTIRAVYDENMKNIYREV